MADATETQITQGPGGRILTNVNVWSPDSQFIVYDTRSGFDGTRFDGTRIEVCAVATGAVQTVYTARNGACCGAATFHPSENRVVFILGPEHPTPDWSYGPAHRQGVMVDLDRPGVPVNLDARDLTPPFTPGMLRGGSHVHVYSPDGACVSFTYNDAVLSSLSRPGDSAPNQEKDQRNVGVSVLLPGVSVPLPGVSVPPNGGHGDQTREQSQSRSHPGTAFSVLVTRTADTPVPGSDQIQRAFEEGWVGSDGYLRGDGTHQKRALAFLGEVITHAGTPLVEVFIVDLPDDLTVPGDDGPLEGTETSRPRPPRGTSQRRLTFTEDRRVPGVAGPRHWVRSTPGGERILFLLGDAAGRAQLWSVSPGGGPIEQITRDPWGVASAFSVSPDGERIAYVADNSVWTVTIATGAAQRHTARSPDDDAPLPLACVFSPDGTQIAFQRRIADSANKERDAPRHNQIFVVSRTDRNKQEGSVPRAGEQW